MIKKPAQSDDAKARSIARDNIVNLGRWLIDSAEQLAADIETDYVLEDGITISATVSGLHAVQTVKVNKEYAIVPAERDNAGI